ncbi:MAG: methylmalonyl Co-A mutase-associated GTPase MeaB, partial [bacterium]
FSFRADGKTVAVVAVDPSSPLTGGAFLGDRIRMQHHTKDSGVFVRSLATRSDIASAPASIAEVVHAIDAYGFDIILIETIGTGQNDTRARDLGDICIVVCAPGFGDFVQSAKAGILEISDFLVVNKSDLAEAQDLFHDLARRFHPDATRHSLPAVVAVSARTGSGVKNLYQSLVKKISELTRSGELLARRRAQFRAELLHHLRSRIASAVSEQSAQNGSLDRAVSELEKRKLDPLTAAESLWRKYLRSSTGQSAKRSGRRKG